MEPLPHTLLLLSRSHSLYRSSHGAKHSSLWIDLSGHEVSEPYEILSAEQCYVSLQQAVIITTNTQPIALVEFYSLLDLTEVQWFVKAAFEALRETYSQTQREHCLSCSSKKSALTLMVLGFFSLTGYGIKRPVCSEANYRNIKHLNEINPLSHYIPVIMGHHIILCKNMSDSISMLCLPPLWCFYWDSATQSQSSTSNNTSCFEPEIFMSNIVAFSSANTAPSD